MNSIDRKLRKLETAKASREPGVCRLAVAWHGVSRERMEALGPDERVVIDWFRHGGMLWGSRRITTDPSDRGRKCVRGGYLLDVLQEIHQSCSHREQAGSCLICLGTPVAEERRLCPELPPPFDTSDL